MKKRQLENLKKKLFAILDGWDSSMTEDQFLDMVASKGKSDYLQFEQYLLDCSKHPSSMIQKWYK